LKIRVLAPHIADLIAAGEVVERPASVVKELLENSIDAGASAITVEIRNGGISYLRVTDNGTGITADDAPKAFLRHATSKISQESDLERIHTLGFRGEALAAISAVSKIDLLTKHRDDPEGCALRLEGGKLISSGAAGCPDGTTIVVRELFYNTPARMKFLRRDSHEGGLAESVVAAAAVSHPEISIKLIREGKEVLHTPGDSILKSAVYSVYGREFVSGMLETEYSNNTVNIYGFTSVPTASRGNRSMQFFYVNKRPVRSKTMNAALEQAYKDKIMKNRYPCCVLFLDIPFELVDVNVHPAKTEVKFADERAVFDAVYFAVKSALEKDTFKKADIDIKPEKTVVFQVTPQAQREEKTKEPEFTKTPVKEPALREKRMPAKEQAFKEQEKPKTHVQESFIKPDGKPDVFYEAPAIYEDKYYNGVKEKKKEIEPPAPAGAVNQPEQVRVLGEIMRTYILAGQGDRLLIIDKHAAHERIIASRLSGQSAPQGQMLLSPQILKLTPAEMNAVIENKSEFEALSFGYDIFGDNEIIVRQIPDGIGEGDILPVISEVAELLIKGVKNGRIEKLDAIINSVACKAAIKAGMKSDINEIISLAETVLSDSDIRYCPHGRPIVVEITKKQLEKLFGRVK
jgi:DNA mismatch repair protein MutL